MLRRSPFNFLVTAAIGGVLWIVTGLLATGALGDAVSLQSLTTSQFVANMQIALAAATVIPLVCANYWYVFGAREAAAANLRDAKKLWVGLMMTTTLSCVIAIVVVIVLMRTEALTVGNLAVITGLFLAQSVVFFWVTTLLMTPKSVKYVPWLAKTVS